jgi:hypothetical protein
MMLLLVSSSSIEVGSTESSLAMSVSPESPASVLELATPSTEKYHQHIQHFKNE